LIFNDFIKMIAVIFFHPKSKPDAHVLPDIVVNP